MNHHDITSVEQSLSSIAQLLQFQAQSAADNEYYLPLVSSPW